MDAIKLLVIEDDLDQQDLLTETLEAAFGQGVVRCVGTAAEAVNADPGDYTLILCDYNLPDACGREVIERMQSVCKTPLIMVTGEIVGDIAADAIQRGAIDYVVKTPDMLTTIPIVIQKNLEVIKLREEREHLLQQLEIMAATDPLTGLYNRRHLSRILEQHFAEAERYEQAISAVMIDLDGYKQFNDTFGHQLGDQLLQVAGNVIRANLRKMDMAARYGGDEFLLLLPHADADEAAGVAERVRADFVRASATLLNQPHGVTMSVGIGSYPESVAKSGQQLVGIADKALYAAKEQGRDRVARYADSLVA